MQKEEKHKNILQQQQNKIKNQKGINVWYTNADVLTQEKLGELKEIISSSDTPDVVAVTEVKPKYYRRKISEVEYQLPGYIMETENLKDYGSSRGIVVYIRDITYRRLEKCAPAEEMISLEIDLNFKETTRCLCSHYLILGD